MLKNLLFLCFVPFLAVGQDLEKKYLANGTYGYEDLMAAWATLDRNSNFVHWHEVGTTDSGEPLMVIELSNALLTVADGIEPSRDKLRILIMNGIHAGESDGVDACLHWAEDLLKKPQIFEEVSIFIIPIYNVGGYKNKGCCTRADQNGPTPLGFRGNATNLDLNRDFMKTDAENTVSFQKLFQTIKPNLFIDTHTTNGADYQYVMTLLPGPLERFPIADRNFLQGWLQNITQTNHKKVKTGPYVNVWGKTPDTGFAAFRQTANFSGGYTALYSVPAITLETHMFKPYPQRVEATVVTLQTILEAAIKFKKPLLNIGWQESKTPDYYPTAWRLDSSAFKTLDFEGFEAENYTSTLTVQKTYRYNRDKPKTFPIKIYDTYMAADSVKKPNYYVLHFGQQRVASILRLNGLPVVQLAKDTTITCSVQYVRNLKSAAQPYEGHFQHSSFDLEERTITEQFYAGDFLVYTTAVGSDFAFEALEPQCEGSFFRWNFFDTYLQQKEWFSSYIFEEKAIAYLNQNLGVKAEFEKKRAEDATFAADHFGQLYWIYKQTPYYEKEHMRIPVFRVF